MLLRECNLFAAELLAFSMALCLNERGSEVTSHGELGQNFGVTVDDAPASAFRPPRALPPRPRPAPAAGFRARGFEAGLAAAGAAASASGVTRCATAAAAGWSTISGGRRRSCFVFRWRLVWLAGLEVSWKTRALGPLS